MTLGDWLKKRVQQKLSPSELAKRLHVSRQAVASALKREIDSFTVGTLRTYGKAAGCKVDLK